MDRWSFILAAYAIAVGGVGGLVAASLAAMRRAERRADELTRRN